MGMIYYNGQSYCSNNNDSPSMVIDDTLSDTSINPVQNKVIKAELDKKPDDFNVTVDGSSVILNDLQGGVPFSEVVVSGENIAGRELTVTACGKNLLKYPYDNTTKTVNGITFTDNGDGSVTVNGTATAGVPFYFINKKEPTFPIDRTYFLSGCPVGGSDSTFDLFFASFNADGDIVDIYGDTGSGTVVNISENVTAINIYIRIREGETVDNLVFRPMLELGSTETLYEPYSGASYAITPDSNPYTVPTEIYQQNGINTVYVTGEGKPTLSVTGVKTNAAVKKIWEDMKSNVQLQSDWNETDVNSDTYILNKPTSLPASDVSDWAKASTKPTYTASEIGLGNVENKSSATIRSELTKTNVTDALGYTPPESNTTYDIVNNSNDGLAPKIDTTFDGVLNMDEPHYILSYINKAGGGDLNWYHLPETAFLDSSQAIDWVKRFDESPESARELLGWVDSLKDYMGEDGDPHNIAEATYWVNSTARDWVDDLMAELGTPAKISAFQSGRVSYTQGTSTSITLDFVPTAIWVSNISSNKNVINIARVDSTSTYFIVPADMQGLTTGTLSYVAFK